MILRSLLCLVAALGWTQSSVAQVISPNAFNFRGGAPEFLAGSEVAARWNVTDPRSASSPGLKINFFGHASNCKVNSNGPVSAGGNPRLSSSQALTGIALDPINGRSWSPSGDTENCEAAVRGKAGDSFVVVNADREKGGVGLFTYTGRDSNNREPFFQQHEPGGKNNSGANANISATYFAWSLRWRDKEVVVPWGPTSGESNPVMELRTTQSVERAVVPKDAPGPNGRQAAQARQQIIFTLFNVDCMREAGSSPRSCRMKYLFNTAIFRAGITSRSADWYSSADTFFDPAQGGVAILHGQIPASGQLSLDKHSGKSMYTSAGPSTQIATFPNPMTFRLRISFSQFKDALRSITSQRLQKPVPAVVDSDVAASFGRLWSDPSQWVLASINISQEVFNTERDKRAFIGGSLRELYLGP